MMLDPKDGDGKDEEGKEHKSLQKDIDSQHSNNSGQKSSSQAG